MQDETMALPPNARALLLPYTEVCMARGLGGEVRYGALVSDMMVQLYEDDGTPLSTPITRYDAGWDNQPCYLIIRGQVEVGPGSYADGVISSGQYESRAAAESQWDRWIEEGIYDERFERAEYRTLAPTIAEVLG